MTAPGPRDGDRDRNPPRPAEDLSAGSGRAGHGIESVFDELEAVAEPVVEAVEMAPAVGIAVAGGPVITFADGSDGPGVVGHEDTVRAGLTQAGPVAVAGMVVNGAAALVVVAVARLVTSQAYGEIAQLLGLFFILSMPGSAVLVGVVRRVSSLRASGQGARVRPWMKRIHRVGVAAIAVEVVLVLMTQHWIAKQLSLGGDGGVFLILLAAGIWILLCVDRGLLQAHRSYRALAANLLVEGGVRTVLVVVLVSAHLGVSGYALAVLVSEVTATAHAHWLAARAWAAEPVPDGVGRSGGSAEAVAGRRKLLADVSAAFIGLALLGFLQNVDVILLGRLDHANVGPYAAISVASKALVFGALALGAYLLPEATIRWNQGGHAVRQLGVTLIFLAVPAAVLLVIAVFVPRWFLTFVFSARLSAAAPAFAALVGAMIFLSCTVLITNYLFGTGSRWIVGLLAAGSGLAAVLTTWAGGRMLATARADLVVQALLAAVMGIAFVGIHLKHRGNLRPSLRPSRRVPLGG